MTWDRSRELCPYLRNCTDPSEKSAERVRSEGRPTAVPKLMSSLVAADD